MDDDGGFVAVDAGNSRLLQWTAGGTFVKFREIAMSPIVGAWRTDSGIVIRVGDALRMKLNFVLFPALRQGKRTFRQTPMAFLSSDTSCSYCPVAVSKRGALALAPSDTSYRIGRYDTRGVRIRSIHRNGIPIVALSPSDRDSLKVLTDRSIRFLRTQKSISSSELAIAIRAASMQLVKPRFVSPGLFFDEVERLWVQRNVASGADAEIDVFDANGDLRATVVLPSGCKMIGVRHNRVLAIRSLTDGLSAIAEFLVSDAAL